MLLVLVSVSHRAALKELIQPLIAAVTCGVFWNERLEIAFRMEVQMSRVPNNLDEQQLNTHTAVFVMI